MAEEASSLSFGNFDFGGTVEGERNFTQGVTDVTLTPEVSYNGVAGWKLTASTDPTIYSEELLLNTALDNVVIDPEAAYALDHAQSSQLEHHGISKWKSVAISQRAYHLLSNQQII